MYHKPIEKKISQNNNSNFIIEELNDTIYNNEKYFNNNLYEIYIFEKGSGNHIIDFENFEITNFSINFVYPGQIQSFSNQKNINGYVIKFTKEFLLYNNEIEFGFFNISNYSINCIRLENEKEYSEIKNILKSLTSEASNKNNYSKEIISLYLKIMLYKMKVVVDSNLSKFNKESKFTIIDYFKKLVDEHFFEFSSVPEYAKLLHLSANELNSLSKKYIKTSASKYIKERIITEAKRYLIHTDYSSKEIAYELNFSDPSNFNKFFKKHTKLTPADYKKKAKVNLK